MSPNYCWGKKRNVYATQIFTFAKLQKQDYRFKEWSPSGNSCYIKRDVKHRTVSDNSGITILN